MTTPRNLALILGAGLVFGIAARSQSPNLPPGPGKEQVAMTCTGCHTSDRISAARKSAAEWQATIAQMKRNGAVVTPQQEATILSYLTTHFAKKSAPGANN